MDPTLAGEIGVMPGTTGQVDSSSAWPIAGQTGVTLGTGTGQHGVSPTGVGNGGGMFGAVNKVWSWLNTPFQQPMDPVTLGLMVGVVLIVVGLEYLPALALAPIAESVS